MRVKLKRGKLLPISLTILSIFGLILLGPAEAFTLSLNTANPVVDAGETISFIASLNINQEERLPVEYLELTIGSRECRFAPDGTPILGCDGISINQVQNADTTFGPREGSFGGTNFSFGYGYGFGYGMPQNLGYEISFDSSTLPSGTYTAQLNARMEGTPILFLGETTQITINAAGYRLFVDKPETSTYDTNRIPFALTTTETSQEISYINYNENNPREMTLCRNCDSFGLDRVKTIVLKEGENRLEFIARSLTGETVTEEITAFIDNKVPRIIRTEPRLGFAHGNFHVEFVELNPENLTMHFGNAQTGMRHQDINISQSCTLERNVHRCDFAVDLEDFNEQDVNYFVTLKDISDKMDASRTRTLTVDLSPPIVGEIEFSIDGNRVTFTIPVDEPNFDRLTYIDSADTTPREHTLCNRLDEGICVETDSFGDGPHSITYTAKDGAGNEANGSIAFFIDSFDPRIIIAQPRNGNADGSFYVRFREANPSQLVLMYGNAQTGQRQYLVDLLNDCQPRGRATECTAMVDLSDYAGQNIMYQFTLTDAVGKMDESNQITLSV